MVGAIVGATKREPIVVGKPSDFMLDNIANELGLARHEICMVRLKQCHSAAPWRVIAVQRAVGMLGLGMCGAGGAVS